jgi:hypothetical protein
MPFLIAKYIKVDKAVENVDNLVPGYPQEGCG